MLQGRHKRGGPVDSTGLDALSAACAALLLRWADTKQSTSGTEQRNQEIAAEHEPMPIAGHQD